MSDEAIPIGTDLAAKHYIDKTNTVSVKGVPDHEQNAAGILASRAAAEVPTVRVSLPPITADEERNVVEFAWPGTE